MLQLYVFVLKYRT